MKKNEESVENQEGSEENDIEKRAKKEEKIKKARFCVSRK
jgi:hypothetical protein